jgi:two-component system, OmpR family, sensor kinase
MSIRLRLTLLYSAILALTLIVFSTTLYVIQSKVTFDDIRDALAHQAQDTVNMTRRGPRRPETPGQILPLPGRWTQIRSGDGTIIARTQDLGDTTLPLSDAGLRAVQDGRPWAEQALVDNDPLLIYNQPYQLSNDVTQIMQVASPIGEREQSLSTLRWILVAGSSLVILGAFAIGWALAGTVLRPIHRITHTAQAIGAERNFSRRVVHAGPNDEIGQLATTFNTMLTALETAYRQVEQALQTQRRFVADASHELRTPLTTVRGNIELLRRGPPLDARERVDILADAKDEVERLIRLVNQLLVLARADAGRPLRCEPLSLGPLVEDVCRQAQLLAPQKAITYAAQKDATVTADCDALKQVLLILLDNAIVHTPPSAAVTVTVAAGERDVAICVRDTGPGIAPHLLPHIFERFYRGDVSRSGGGAGLGLSIAQELAQAQAGSLTVTSDLGRGSEFRLTLPQPAA